MNKFNKGKLIGVVAASLSAVSLMGVGFASWVLTGEKPDTIGNILVDVGDVDDQRIQVVKENTGSSGSLVFDSVVDAGGPITSTETHESLSFKIFYKVKVAKSVTNFKVTAQWTPGTKISSAITNNYIASPFGTDAIEVARKTAVGTAGITNSETKVTTAGYHTDAPATSTDGNFNVYSYTTQFDFAWGSAFGNANPVYEKGGKSADEIVTALAQLKDIKGEKLTITLTPSVVTGE